MELFSAIKLDADEVKRQEEHIRQEVRTLSDPERKLYFERFKRHMKDPDTYAVLNWFFLAGLHHMYLEDYTRGSVNLVVMVVSIGLLFTPLFFIGAILIAFVLVIELMALFRSQVVVANHNNQVAERILADLTD